MVSRPSYVMTESDKSLPVYLNGEITLKKIGRKTTRKVKWSFRAVDIKENKIEDLTQE